MGIHCYYYKHFDKAELLVKRKTQICSEIKPMIVHQQSCSNGKCNSISIQWIQIQTYDKWDTWFIKKPRPDMLAYQCFTYCAVLLLCKHRCKIYNFLSNGKYLHFRPCEQACCENMCACCVLNLRKCFICYNSYVWFCHQKQDESFKLLV